MPTVLTKLPCGIIHTAGFAEHLRALAAAQGPRHRHEILALDYIRCASGPQKGAAWWQMTWLPEQQAAKSYRFRIGEVEVFIHRQTQRGLKGKCLHFDGERVVVKE